MTADQLTAGLHLQGLVVGADFEPHIPVVRRVRRRCRCHRLIRVDVTWTTGGQCRYQPTDVVEVLP